MEEKHREYGRACHLQDIDCLNDMWIEHKSGELVALAEFKQDYELIELFKYKAMKTLADNSKIPFYIVVGYKHLGPGYYLIPMNDYAKEIPWMEQERFWSEKNYIRLLHYLRKIDCPAEALAGKSGKTPPPETALPNIKR
jgi:hypothetical protein